MRVIDGCSLVFQIYCVPSCAIKQCKVQHFFNWRKTAQNIKMNTGRSLYGHEIKYTVFLCQGMKENMIMFIPMYVQDIVGVKFKLIQQTKELVSLNRTKYELIRCFI